MHQTSGLMSKFYPISLYKILGKFRIKF